MVADLIFGRCHGRYRDVGLGGIGVSVGEAGKVWGQMGANRGGYGGSWGIMGVDRTQNRVTGVTKVNSYYPQKCPKTGQFFGHFYG